MRSALRFYKNSYKNSVALTQILAYIPSRTARSLFPPPTHTEVERVEVKDPQG
jgi:hypothetical protein